MMHLSSFYQERIQRFSREEAVLARKNVRYAWLRLATLAAAIVGGIYFAALSPWAGAGAVAVCLIAFFGCLKAHLRCIGRQKEAERFKTINRQEADSLNGDDSAYSSGDRYIDAKHDYTSDLDIFGAHSVFRHTNRTTSPSGSDLLAAWLSAPASTPDIERRQQAVQELAGMVDWRQQIQSVGLKYKTTAESLPDFLLWLKSETVLSHRRRLLQVMQVLPCITLLCAVVACMGWIQAGWLWLPVTAHLLIAALVAGKVNVLHRQVSHKVEFVSTYAELIAPIADADFSSPYLASLQKVFTDGKAAEHIRALKNRIKRLDYRLNIMFIPVNLLFFFDYRHLAWLEKWRMTVGRTVPEWFDAIAAIEALSGFANLRFNHPEWVFPEIKADYFTLAAVHAGHPLIRESERICNDFSTDGEGKISIVTGSNMSGKSTFLRSIGVNMALALAGAPVCAKRFAVTNCKIYTYMRIADNLEERTSSFYAELKRLKQLMDITRNGQQVFFLLDEILRGTNSRDRQTGSMALIRQLVRQQVSGIIATHDLALGELEAELPQNIRNAHFDVQINGEDMAFDYKLHAGICTSLNASVLMKKIGIEI